MPVVRYFRVITRWLEQIWLARAFRTERDQDGSWALWLDYGVGFRPSGSFPTLAEAEAAGAEAAGRRMTHHPGRRPQAAAIPFSPGSIS